MSRIGLALNGGFAYSCAAPVRFLIHRFAQQPICELQSRTSYRYAGHIFGNEG